jgi:hypothetical protein
LPQFDRQATHAHTFAADQRFTTSHSALQFMRTRSLQITAR